jgi:hypothetical protein
MGLTIKRKLRAEGEKQEGARPPPLRCRGRRVGELFALCSAGGDADLRRAAGIIRKMSSEERRDVRAGIQTLSEMIDDIVLEELRQKRIDSRKS